MKRGVLVAVVSVLCVVLLGGCIIIGNEVKPDNFGQAKEGNRVGGGFNIKFIAPEDGTIHLLDKKSGKNILTESITANTEYRFSATDLNKEQYKKWGVDVNKADFVLYFYPKNPKPMTPMPPMAPEAPAPTPGHGIQ
ncbi:MAG: hypothetical protein ABFD91_00110 [Anaerohalosphaeraceae bacterium]